MFGNALGWSISVVLVLLTVGVLWWVEAQASRAGRADAFGLDPSRVAPLALPPATLVAPGMVSGAPVEARYAELIDRALANAGTLEAFVAGRDENPPGSARRVFELLRPMIDARHAAGARIFSAQPETLVNYENTPARLAAIDFAGRAALRLAWLRRQDDPESSKALLEAVFALGHYLFEERLTYAELDLGMRLMAEAVAALKHLARDTELEPGPTVARLDSFDSARLALATERILPVAARVRSLDGRVVSENAGNVRHWAAGAAEERVWRVEAILATGRLRHFVGQAGRAGDRVAAERLLARLEADDDIRRDPVLAAAVRAARSLTPERFRLLR